MLIQKVTKLFFLLGLILLIQSSLIGCSTNTEKVNTSSNAIKIVEGSIEAFNNKDIEKVLGYLASDFVYEDNYGVVTDKEEMEAILQEMFEIDGQINVTSIVEIDNKVVVKAAYDDFITELFGLESHITETYEVSGDKIKYYTSFFEEDYLIKFEEAFAGGIGLELEYIDNTVTVVDIISGSPAQKAGVEIGDVIIAIDHNNVSEFKYGMHEVIYRMTGKIGTEVVLTLKHKENDEERDIVMERVNKQEMF